MLDLIRFTPGGISRVEIARTLDLSRAAVTSIVSDLLETATIREAESRIGQSGRPPIVLEINPARGYVVGVDFGATHLSLLLANMGAQVLDDLEVDLEISRGPQECLAEADRLLRGLLHRAGLSLDQVLAIGVGVPGPIVAEAGMVLSPPIM
ncbi:MAG: ROK family protein, partial [Chloroflexi bacterium]|nr:ROK family protein [Chloroflexota bacterium]